MSKLNDDYGVGHNCGVCPNCNVQAIAFLVLLYALAGRLMIPVIPVTGNTRNDSYRYKHR